MAVFLFFLRRLQQELHNTWIYSLIFSKFFGAWQQVIIHSDHLFVLLSNTFLGRNLRFLSVYLLFSHCLTPIY